jgi:predicted dehydrogenase
MSASRRRFLKTASLALGSAWTGLPLVHAGGQERARTYRACLIGHTGRGNYGHDLDLSFRRVPRVTVVAVADPDEKGRLAAAKRSGAARAYADFREMLKQEKPDLVAVCPRFVESRLEMVAAAAEAGAHAFVEKPIARSLEEADAMVAAAERHRTRVVVAHPARLHPTVLHLRKRVREGLVGDLMEVRARGKEDHRAGGEDLMVHGPHCFYLMRAFAGDPVWCSGRVTVQGREARAEDRREASEPVGPVAGDAVRADYAFPGGVHGYFASQRAGAPVTGRFQIALHGAKGVAVLHIGFEPAAFYLPDPHWSPGKSGAAWQPLPDAPPRGDPSGAEGCNKRIVEDWLRWIETGERSDVSLEEGRSTLEMIHAVYASHLSGKRVSFPLEGRKHPLG